MMTTQLTEIKVAHSPDSDDAFMFWALAKNQVDTEGLTFTHHLSDIETLNKEAMTGKYELTAISYHAYAYLQDKYDILTCGSSVGDKYGPVLIAKTPLTQEDLRNTTIAIPGEWTTATLALKLWMPDCKTEVVPFDEIMDRVQDGTYKAGLIIHEGQLTYKEEGFSKVVDLGEWWYEETNLPLPLGGNAIRKDLGEELSQKIARVLLRSIEAGLANREEALEYAKSFGRGLDDAKVDRFVGMYVNEMTLVTTPEIERAVELLLLRAFGQGLIPNKPTVKFISPVSQPLAVAAH